MRLSLFAALSIFLSCSAQAATFQTYSSQSSFVAATGAAYIAFPPGQGVASLTTGNVTVTDFNVGGMSTANFTSALPDEIATAFENFEFFINGGAFSFGFSAIDPLLAGRGLDRCDVSICEDTTFDIRFYTAKGGSLLFSDSFNPPSTTTSFHGYFSDTAFSYITLEQRQTSNDDELFGLFHVGQSAALDLPDPPDVTSAGGPYVFDHDTLSVTLTGSGSDPDGDESYSWSGPAGTLADAGGTLQSGLPTPAGSAGLASSGITRAALSAADSAALQTFTLTATDSQPESDFASATAYYLNTAPTIDAVSGTYQDGLITVSADLTELDLKTNALMGDGFELLSWEIALGGTPLFAAEDATFGDDGLSFADGTAALALSLSLGDFLDAGGMLGDNMLTLTITDRADATDVMTFTITIPAIPAPAALGLILIGAAGLFCVSRFTQAGAKIL